MSMFMNSISLHIFVKTVLMPCIWVNGRNSLFTCAGTISYYIASVAAQSYVLLTYLCISHARTLYVVLHASVLFNIVYV